jgi:hypothetical protein
VKITSGSKKALKVVANGELARGGRMFRDYCNRLKITIAAFDEAKTGRRRQSAKAKKPRPDAFNGLIEEILQRKPKITVDELIDECRKEAGGDIIYEINDDDRKVVWIDKKAKRERLRDAPFSGLKDRLSRARKNI